MAIIILGGLLTSIIQNTVVVPALFLRYGRKEQRESSEPAQQRVKGGAST
ncbi:MAG: hypothetical protein WD423_02255 [Rhodothermales bacterium]